MRNKTEITIARRKIAKILNSDEGKHLTELNSDQLREIVFLYQQIDRLQESDLMGLYYRLHPNLVESMSDY